MRMKHEGAVLRSDYECMTDQPTALWDVAGDSQRYDNFFCFENGPKSGGNTC